MMSGQSLHNHVLTQPITCVMNYQTGPLQLSIEDDNQLYIGLVPHKDDLRADQSVVKFHVIAEVS